MRLEAVLTTQLKFDAITGVLLPQKISYNVQHEEEIEEMLEKYIKKKTNYQINYDQKGNAIFIKKEKSKKREQQE